MAQAQISYTKKNGNQPQEMIARKEILVSKKWHSQLEYQLDCLATSVLRNTFLLPGVDPH